MKGKCSLCGTKCGDEFCQGCVYYLQKQSNKALIPTRDRTSYTPPHDSDRVFRQRSNFLTLQTCNYNEG